MMTQLPRPWTPAASRTEVFTSYLNFFRERVIAKLQALPPAAVRTASLPSGWTPAQLLRHLTCMERRWLEWGFLGLDVGDPWADHRDGRWHVADDVSVESLVAQARAQGARSAAIIAAHDLGETGQPGERWAGQPPATLERVLFHMMQEYARHLGHLDIVAELADGQTGE